MTLPGTPASLQASWGQTDNATFTTAEGITEEDLYRAMEASQSRVLPSLCTRCQQPTSRQREEGEDGVLCAHCLGSVEFMERVVLAPDTEPTTDDEVDRAQMANLITERLIWGAGGAA